MRSHDKLSGFVGCMAWDKANAPPDYKILRYLQIHMRRLYPAHVYLGVPSTKFRVPIAVTVFFHYLSYSCWASKVLSYGSSLNYLFKFLKYNMFEFVLCKIYPISSLSLRIKDY